MNGMNKELIVIAIDRHFRHDLKYEVIHNMDNKCLNFDNNLMTQLKRWVDRLGEESAEAQYLKQSITSFKKLIDHSNEDKIYLLLQMDKNSDTEWSAVGFVRIGTRNLWFADKDNTNLRQIENCFCILDFYIRDQRHGFGLFLIQKAMESLHRRAAQFAYDRPTEAMLSFLSKHFGLKQPLPQHNHFVIYDSFHSNY